MRLPLRVVMVPVIMLLATSAMASTEFRGVWVDAFHPGFKNHAQVSQLVNWASENHINALLIQVRKRGDVYFNSTLEPKASDISADYDPLADVIEQAHAVGIQIHAWVSVYEVMQQCKWYSPAATHVSRTHPEWLMCKRDGSTTFYEARTMFLDPGVPEARDHIIALIREIAKTYDVDGINLDSPGYPGTRDGGYNTVSVARFNQQFSRSGVPDNEDPAWTQWRRDQVTALVSQAHSAVAAVRPKALFSASVASSDAQKCSDVVFQEWGKWVRLGLLAFVIPFAYLDEKAPITDLTASCRQALTSSSGCQVYMGLGTWQLGVDAAKQQIGSVRAAGTSGFVLFNYHYLGPNSSMGSCVKGSDLRADVIGVDPGAPVLDQEGKPK